jgi:hypothetical protein
MRLPQPFVPAEAGTQGDTALIFERTKYYPFRFSRMPMRSSRGSTSSQKYGSSLR